MKNLKSIDTRSSKVFKNIVGSLNPGSCGSWGGSAGIIEVEDGKILRCFNFRYGDEEELK